MWDPYMSQDCGQAQDLFGWTQQPQQQQSVPAPSAPHAHQQHSMPPSQLQQQQQQQQHQQHNQQQQQQPPPHQLQLQDALPSMQHIPDQTFQMNSLTSPVLSHCSTPQTSLLAPVAHGVAEQMAWELQEQQKEQQALAEAAQVDAIPQLQVETEPDVKQYMSQPAHSARPTRRIIRTQVPSQHEGSMKGSAPGEGQALAKTPKADEESHKLRTKVEEVLAAHTEATPAVA